MAKLGRPPKAQMIGSMDGPDAKRIDSSSIGRKVVTAQIDFIGQSTPVRHGLGKKPDYINQLVPSVNGYLYYSADDWNNRTAEQIFVRGSAVGSYPVEVW